MYNTIPTAGPAGANRFAGLDHLRAIAIIIVFVFHYNIFAHAPGLYKYFGSWGWTGVDLFFVLSGFLIGGQLFAKLARNQPIHYGEFYFKRTLRILPAYFVVLTGYYAIPAFIERGQLPPLWRMITFTQNFGLDLSQHGAFSHAWSLCIEEQFYLVFPLLLILCKTQKRAVWLLPIFFLAGFAARAYIWYDILPKQANFGRAYYSLIYYPTWSRLDGLLAGVSLAALYYFKPKTWQKITRHGNLLLAGALLLIAGAWFIAHDDHQYEIQGVIFGYPAIAIAYGALVLAALSPTCLLYRYPSRIMRFIATLSYAIYLTHKQLIHLTLPILEKVNIREDSYIAFVICIAVSVLGGWLLHQTIEKPILHLRDRYLAKSSKTEKKAPAPLLNSR